MYKQTAFPKYKGFNLGYLLWSDYTKGKNDTCSSIDRQFFWNEECISALKERINTDLEMIADLGFNFVRLPLNYRNFIANYNEFWDGEVFQFDELKIAPIDFAVERAKELGIYVEFALHRAPGYSVVREPEDECCSLWYDVKAKEAFKRIWKAIALRYKAVTKKYLGYNLVNEPPYEKHQKGLPIEVHNEIMMGAINEIRGIGDERTIFVDGMRWGRDPLVGLCIPGVVQSCRAYDPAVLTHHGVNDFPVDSLKWPGIVSHDAVSFENLVVWDRERLYKQYEIWAKMAQEYNVGVHCGEGGVYKDAPYEDAIHWFEDVMDILNGFNIGFAMWNLRGPFGIIDSQRKGCKYTDYKGHLLDKRMLEIMKR